MDVYLLTGQSNQQNTVVFALVRVSYAPLATEPPQYHYHQKAATRTSGHVFVAVPINIVIRA